MDIGLLDPFVREIKTALDGMKNDLRRGHDFDGASLLWSFKTYGPLGELVI